MDDILLKRSYNEERWTSRHIEYEEEAIHLDGLADMSDKSRFER